MDYLGMSRKEEGAREGGGGVMLYYDTRSIYLKS